MKKIYIILSQSGTGVSKFLKFFSKKDYNHSSIALNPSLDEFYSFGRKKVNNFLIGGFIVEHKNTGVFLKYPCSPCIILELPISDNQYENLEKIIRNFIENIEKYKYSFIGIPFVGLNINIKRKNKFFCSQFVGYVLNLIGIKTLKAPEHLEPIDFMKLDNAKIIYKGYLQNYSLT